MHGVGACLDRLLGLQARRAVSCDDGAVRGVQALLLLHEALAHHLAVLLLLRRRAAIEWNAVSVRLLLLLGLLGIVVGPVVVVLLEGRRVLRVGGIVLNPTVATRCCVDGVLAGLRLSLCLLDSLLHMVISHCIDLRCCRLWMLSLKTVFDLIDGWDVTR